MSLLDKYEDYKNNKQQNSLLQKYENYKQQNQANKGTNINNNFSFNMNKPIVGQIKDKVNSLNQQQKEKILKKLQEEEEKKKKTLNIGTGVISPNNIQNKKIQNTSAIKLASEEEKKNSKEIKNNNLFSQSGKIIENAWLGMDTGLKNMQQSIHRAINNNQVNQQELFEQQYNKVLNKKLQHNPDKEYIINQTMNNVPFSSKTLKTDLEDILEKKQEQKNKNSQKIETNTLTINNNTMKELSQLAPTIGQMIPGFVPGAGMVYLGGSAKGSYYDDAIQRGMNEEEANKYSSMMALAEAGTEMLGINRLKKAGQGIKTITKGEGIKGLSKNIAKEEINQNIKSVLKDYGIGIADNVIQEAIIDPIQELTAQTVAGENKANWDNIGRKMIQDGISGGIVSAILGAGNLGVQSCVGLSQKLQNNQKITTVELNKALEDSKKAGFNVENIIKDNIENNVQNNISESTVKQKNIQNNIVNPLVNKNVKNKNIEPINKTNILIKDSQAKYIDNNNNENNIYFRFDDKNGFKGKEHQSSVSMWEEQIDDLLTPNYDSYMTDIEDIDFEMAEREINSLLEPYNLDYDEYSNLPDEEKSKIKRKIGLDKGYITDGASSFALNKDGIEEYINYIKTHPINEYEEVNIFTGQENGFGADGEFIVKPKDTLYTDTSNNITEILENESLNSEQKNNEIVRLIRQKMLQNLNNKDIISNESEGVSNAELSRDIYGRGRGVFENGIISSSEENINTRNRPESQRTSFEAEQGKKYQEFIDYASNNRITFPTKVNAEIISEGKKIGLDVILFSGNEKFDYLGMTDKDNPNKIYIDVKQNETHGKDILYHEFLHSLKRSGNSIFNEKIQPILDYVIEDKTVIDNFIKEKRTR